MIKQALFFYMPSLAFYMAKFRFICLSFAFYMPKPCFLYA